MNKRKLGINGPELTEIGLGAWAIGGPWQWGWGPSDDNESINTIHAALDAGINWIDTAASYGLGHSEEIVGKALKGKRDQIFIATKCGIAWNNKNKIRHDLTPLNIRRELEASLSRLQTDVIDLYQFHWPDPKTKIYNSWREVVKLKEEGKIHWIGVSNFDVPLLQKCEKIHHVDSLQPPYNMLNRDVESEILPYCQKNGIGVVPYSPMNSGLLSGKFDINKLAPDDWRRKSPKFMEPQLAGNLALVEKLRGIALKYDKTVGQLAVAWVLKHPAVTSAIVGARRVEQVQQNILAADWKIEQDDLKEIENLLAQKN